MYPCVHLLSSAPNGLLNAANYSCLCTLQACWPRSGRGLASGGRRHAMQPALPQYVAITPETLVGLRNAANHKCQATLAIAKARALCNELAAHKLRTCQAPVQATLLTPCCRSLPRRGPQAHLGLGTISKNDEVRSPAHSGARHRATCHTHLQPHTLPGC